MALSEFPVLAYVCPPLRMRFQCDHHALTPCTRRSRGQVSICSHGDTAVKRITKQVPFWSIRHNEYERQERKGRSRG